MSLDIATLRHDPPFGRRARIAGYAVDAYRCPPCPPGAQCKPCIMHSALFVAGTAEHARFSWSNPPPDIAAIGVDDPAPFIHGVRYRFDVQVADPGRAGDVDATLISSQPAGGER